MRIVSVSHEVEIKEVVCASCGNEATLRYVPGAGAMQTWPCAECGRANQTDLPGTLWNTVGSIRPRE